MMRWYHAAHYAGYDNATMVVRFRRAVNRDTWVREFNLAHPTGPEVRIALPVVEAEALHSLGIPMNDEDADPNVPDAEPPEVPNVPCRLCGEPLPAGVKCRYVLAHERGEPTPFDSPTSGGTR